MRRRCRKFARLAAGGRWIRTIGPPYYGALREWRVLRHFRGELVGDFEVPAFRRDAVDDAGLGGTKYWALLNFRGAAAFATEVTLTGRFFTAGEALASREARRANATAMGIQPSYGPPAYLQRAPRDRSFGRVLTGDSGALAVAQPGEARDWRRPLRSLG